MRAELTPAKLRLWAAMLGDGQVELAAKDMRRIAENIEIEEDMQRRAFRQLMVACLGAYP